MKVSGKKIKELRGEKPIEGLALAADLSTRRVQQIEQGELAHINLNVAKAMAKHLGVPLDHIAA